MLVVGAAAAAATLALLLVVNEDDVVVVVVVDVAAVVNAWTKDDKGADGAVVAAPLLATWDPSTPVIVMVVISS